MESIIGAAFAKLHDNREQQARPQGLALDTRARVLPPGRCPSRKSQAESGVPSRLLLAQVRWIPPLATQTLRW
ncbi:unnamed protein product [Rangifer tarandus platyrhynchus]|uniref:Uncharacterized protein n=1 Tax=Rangifer tarandus platyrhynchus TaxID=3082113 RepID=A0AC59YF51_RANTA